LVRTPNGKTPDILQTNQANLLETTDWNSAVSARYVCPVCGYPNLSEPPREADGAGSYEICSSCGFEFGFTDEDHGFSDEAWRERWIALGMPWKSRSIKPPPGWNPRQQLANLLHDGSDRGT
jgi:hypothetical protein